MKDWLEISYDFLRRNMKSSKNRALLLCDIFETRLFFCCPNLKFMLDLETIGQWVLFWQGTIPSRLFIYLFFFVRSHVESHSRVLFDLRFLKRKDWVKVGFLLFSNPNFKVLTLLPGRVCVCVFERLISNSVQYIDI